MSHLEICCLLATIFPAKPFDPHGQSCGPFPRSCPQFARAYNRRKERMNAFWGDDFHATLLEEGEYLERG
jgi:hypothetical protein